MDQQFDELSKSLAEGVSRREARRKFALPPWPEPSARSTTTGAFGIFTAGMRYRFPPTTTTSRRGGLAAWR